MSLLGMMHLIIGEAVSTFLLLFLGLGLTQFDSQATQKKIASYWVIAVFIGNVVGHRLGSANMNPIFLFQDTILKQHSALAFVLGIFAEMLGAMVAVIILLGLPSAKNKQLQDYAAVAGAISCKKAMVFEAAATFSLLWVSKTAASFTSGWTNFFIVSLFIGGLVYFVGPLTGASLNPVRDLVPRLLYVKKSNRWPEIKNSLVSSTVAPILGGVLFISFF
ncbi:aquaporin [Enterococcus sp. AD013-P3]|uniref:aquaporin n=1 Tax=Enterococcus sp. AD013-P3 TaxID=3411036 RepID=UPI003B9586A2